MCKIKTGHHCRRSSVARVSWNTERRRSIRGASVREVCGARRGGVGTSDSRGRPATPVNQRTGTERENTEEDSRKRRKEVTEGVVKDTPGPYLAPTYRADKSFGTRT